MDHFIVPARLPAAASRADRIDAALHWGVRLWGIACLGIVILAQWS